MNIARLVVGIGAVAAMLACAVTAAGNHSRLELVTFGSATSAGIHADGRVSLTTDAPLVSSDTDTAADIYEFADGVYTLVSVPTNPAHGSAPVTGSRSSPDGSALLWIQGDTTYRRSGNSVTTLCPVPANFGQGSPILPDGTVLIFARFTPVLPGDTDNSFDIYRCSGGEVTAVTDGTSNSHVLLEVLFPSGHLWFRTTDSLSSADTDGGASDLYEYNVFSSTYELVDPAPPATVKFRAPTRDRVWLETDQPLEVSDNDGGEIDIYLWRRAGGTLELLTTGPFVANGPADHLWSSASLSEDLEALTFVSTDQLTFDDTNASADQYKRENGVTTLLGPPPPPEFNVHKAKVGDRKVIVTAQSFSPADTDGVDDLYEDVNGTKTLLSVGPNGGNQPFPAAFAGGSDDLSRVFFYSSEALVSGDNDGRRDIFERFSGQTTWLSRGPTGGTGPFTPDFGSASGDGTKVTFSTSESLVSADTDTTDDTYLASVAGPGYPRPKAASPLQVSLTSAYEQCNAPDRTHGPPLAFGSCSSPTETSDFLTVGTADANGMPPRMQGTLRLGTVIGNPASPADEADVGIRLSVSDVFSKALADYTGELRASVPLRVTDKNSNSVGGGAYNATITDFPFEFDAACVATADPQEGSLCSIDTTADAVLPGAIVEGQRANMEIGQVQVFDGGADGDGATEGDNTLFAVQGVFIP